MTKYVGWWLIFFSRFSIYKFYFINMISGNYKSDDNASDSKIFNENIFIKSF